MRSFITILVFLIGIIAIACSSNTLGPTEKDLEQRAQFFLMRRLMRSGRISMVFSQ